MMSVYPIERFRPHLPHLRLAGRRNLSAPNEARGDAIHHRPQMGLVGDGGVLIHGGRNSSTEHAADRGAWHGLRIDFRFVQYLEQVAGIKGKPALALRSAL